MVRAPAVALMLLGCARPPSPANPGTAPAFTPAAPLSATSPQPGEIITGRVVHLVSGAPLSGALVVLSCNDGSTEERTTDDAGSFTFTAVASDDCSVQALLSRGTVSTKIGPDAAARRSVELRLDPEQKYKIEGDLRRREM